MAREYADVRGHTGACFVLNNYEWIPASKLTSCTG